MKDSTVNSSRRRFMKASAAGAAALPLGYLLASAPVRAQDKLDENDPAAKALFYKHAASTVDHAKFVKGSNCANCQLYAGKADDAWAPCPIFQNKLVAAEGWCTAWVKIVG